MHHEALMVVGPRGRRDVLGVPLLWERRRCITIG